MLDRSAQRVLSEYRDDPYLAGKVVETLADLYGALEDIEGQVPLLEGFLKQAGPEADPEVAGVSRAEACERGASAREHRSALRSCSRLPQALLARRDPPRYAEQRLEGMVMRGRLQRALHDLDGSIATYKAALVSSARRCQGRIILRRRRSTTRWPSRT